MNPPSPKTNPANRKSFFDSPWCGLVWLGISTLVCLISAKSVSPLFVHEGWDSAIFKIIGQGILDGKLPYRDLFDHKGPVIFYLNALGLGVAGGKVGLFALNALFLTATLYLVYRTSRLFSSAKRSLGISLLSLLYWVFLSQGGNLTEIYALPAVALSLYLVLRLYQNPQKTFAGYFIGLGFAWMLLLRMNDAVMLPGGLFAGFFLFGLIQKRYRQTLVATLWFLAGTATLILPFVVYFAAHNALADFWYGQFTFNYLYSKQNPHTFVNYGNLLVGVVLLGSCMWAAGKRKEKRYLYFIFVPVAVLSFLLLGKRLYAHYFLVFLPFLTLLVNLFCAWLTKKLTNVSPAKRYYVIPASCLLLAGVAGIPVHLARRLDRDSKTAKVYAQAGHLFDKIPESERNDIWCYNVTSCLGIFPRYALVPCNRIFCCWHLNYDNLAETESILSHRPNWVLVDRVSWYWDHFDYIEKNYERVCQTDPTVCQLELYRWSGTEP